MTQLGDGSELKEEQRQASLSKKGDAIHLEVDLGVLSGKAVMDNVAVEATQSIETGNSLKTNKRRGSRKEVYVRTHAMKTRNKKANGVGSWNLEAKIFKAIEKQFYKKKCLLGRNEDSLSLEEKITKVQEIEVAVGFDFEGIEEDLFQVIAQMEEEDKERHQDVSTKQN
ncbi:hypothetical protein QYF36_018645 [Acer negundo]|nr:hypothetical protein QYF36_018645 [Acer negundo]